MEKDDSFFSKRTKDGLNVWCKECTKEYSKNYYQLNKDEFSKNNKEYYINNSEKIKIMNIVNSLQPLWAIDNLQKSNIYNG